MSAAHLLAHARINMQRMPHLPGEFAPHTEDDGYIRAPVIREAAKDDLSRAHSSDSHFITGSGGKSRAKRFGVTTHIEATRAQRIYTVDSMPRCLSVS